MYGSIWLDLRNLHHLGNHQQPILIGRSSRMIFKPSTPIP